MLGKSGPLDESPDCEHTMNRTNSFCALAFKEDHQRNPAKDLGTLSSAFDGGSGQTPRETEESRTNEEAASPRHCVEKTIR